MFSALIDQYGWFVIIGAILVLWIVFKFVRGIVFKVLGLAFAVVSLVRLWSFFNMH